MTPTRELLELAAKAANIEYGWQHIFDDYEGSTSEKWDWNPLTDDGDAFRLAVKLNFSVRPGYVSTPNHGGFDEGKLRTIQDPYAATRRAIVRAAAEIGRGMA